MTNEVIFPRMTRDDLDLIIEVLETSIEMERHALKNLDEVDRQDTEFRIGTEEGLLKNLQAQKRLS